VGFGVAHPTWGNDQRMAGAEKVGAQKTSMLQDLEAGRPLELEAAYASPKMLDEQSRNARTS
jgi:ketopantoate reductase